MKWIAGTAGAAAGAGAAMLIRTALGMPLWKPAPVIVAGAAAGFLAFLAAALGIRKLLKIDLARGLLSGLGGFVLGMAAAMLMRHMAGWPVWNGDSVLTSGALAGLIAYLAALRVFDHWARWIFQSRGGEIEREQRSGWIRYLGVDTNHKVIGVQYAVTGLCLLPFAVGLQLLGRTHMADPHLGILSNMTYESVISDHGITMMFLVVLPIFSGFMNYFVPLQIGARDMAFPRLNAFSFWLVPPAGLLAAFSLMAGGFDTGWTAYPPLSVSFENPGMNFVLIAVYLTGLSSILTAINVLTTTFKMRARGMSFFRMPIFMWSSLATVGLTLLFTQFIGMAFLMVLFERLFGFAFFDPSRGGQVLLYQFLFWFYSHPAVYVFVLIGLGMISDIIPVFSRKPLFGYKGVAISSPAIAFGGTIVFAHHMFAAGMPEWLRVPFMVTTLLVAVPTGVKVFAWTATTWMSKMSLQTPLLFVLSAIVLFLIGGLTGIPLGIVPIDLYLHATYWVVGHFHAMFFGGFLLPAMAAVYYWFPKVTGRMLSEKIGKVQWLLMTVGMFLLAMPMLILGLEGMRRRTSSYVFKMHFQELHILTAVGGFTVFAGLVLLAYNMVKSFRHGPAAGDNPWGARTLEWMVSSPPPDHNFDELPEILDRPHMHGVTGSVHAKVKIKKEGRKIDR
jgi:cytochrome c oxidase subunit 1